MDVLFFVTATSYCTSITVSSWNFRNDTNHGGSMHDINKQAAFFISLTTAFETRKIWKTVEYKVYTELWKMKYLHGIFRRKSSEAKSHEIMRNVIFNVNIQSQLFTIIRLCKNCFASTSVLQGVFLAFRNLQPAINIQVPIRGSRKGTVLCVGHCKEPYGEMHHSHVMGVRAEAHQTHLKL